MAVEMNQLVSHYQIIKKLGAGGMGEVYLAEDIKLKRPVALKFLSPQLIFDAEAKQRFEYEARAASKLDHPHICTIFEIDQIPDGQLFIAMAYYDGETLDKKIGKLKITEIVDFGLAKLAASPAITRSGVTMGTPFYRSPEQVIRRKSRSALRYLVAWRRFVPTACCQAAFLRREYNGSFVCDCFRKVTASLEAQPCDS